nr:hypothetical protein DBT53_08855 [Aerococcus mictus]
MLSPREQRLALLGYIMLMVSLLGFFSIYLHSSSSPLSIWVILMLIGGSIVGWKTLKFSSQIQIKLVLCDLLFILNFYILSKWELKYGLNYILAGFLGSILITYINEKFLK